ncbi:hypothetical protein QBC33DRAFT_548381 [Phialemonium atrogriseum]|uniref:SnoaL-like domain-containing protein n=1 Tax=Phialemonium atrogriseum TaxID=1093897 RepID=A0AAJ0BXN3_9PEZI|nr:uncharacterized protein QBC33DRAFT_548381 [Phialemonium atrogriseum]KAK1763941.1 hypothetical protein QBC33DRAFT_548381 [Phialemonium atrogriseum]
MSHSYKSQYPFGVEVESSIVEFFERFYRVSDTPGAHDEYVDMFTNDATFILASKSSRGREDILSMRHGMWSSISSRKHTVPKIFPFGSSSREFMLYGSVKFDFKDGKEGEVDWAARAELSSQDGVWRMSFYQVYLDTGANIYGKK